jgi:hypothetical protein
VLADVWPALGYVCPAHARTAVAVA